jgi:hypothetical protein
MNSNIVHGNYFSFAEIVKGRNDSVYMTSDGFLHVIDLVMVITGHNRDTSGKILRRLDPAVFHPDKIQERQSFTGNGSRMIKLISCKNAIELIMVLPGTTAKETRVQIASIIQRLIAGDLSPIKEVKTNANSRDSVNEMARKEMKRNADEDFEQNMNKHRKRGHDLDVSVLRIAVENKKRDLANEEMDIDVKHAKYMQTIMEVQGTIIDKYVSICSMESIDQEATTLFKENLLKIATQSTKFMGVFSPVV